MPIILMSALAYDEIMRLAQGIRVAAILCKPFRLSDLRMATNDVMHQAVGAKR